MNLRQDKMLKDIAILEINPINYFLPLLPSSIERSLFFKFMNKHLLYFKRVIKGIVRESEGKTVKGGTF